MNAGQPAKANDSDFTQISDTLEVFGSRSFSVDKVLSGDEPHLSAHSSTFTFNFASSASHWIKAALHTVLWPFYALKQSAQNPPSGLASQNL